MADPSCCCDKKNINIMLAIDLTKKNKKVALGMSGGVDSSVAAYILLRQGYDVEGFFMKFWTDPDSVDTRSNRCCSIEDFMDAQHVAAKLGIRLNTINFSDRFKENIVDDFIEGYDSGVTPNPCVRCNQYIKMGGFWEYVKKLGFDFIATGHYSLIECDSTDVFHIKRSVDTHKDQTYFLYRLNQETISHTLFPVGDYVKGDIKKIALEHGFITAKKKESQELCFLENNGLMDFLSRYGTVSGGDIVDIDNDTVLGGHLGLQAYTIGQRKGLGLHGGPWFVVKKNLRKNILYVTTDPNHKALQSDRILLRDVTWTSGSAPTIPFRVMAVTRYSQELQSAILYMDGESIYVKFDEARRSVTPGQSLVMYDKDRLLGGGVIC